jgi:hypothetical protein
LDSKGLFILAATFQKGAACFCYRKADFLRKLLQTV